MTFNGIELINSSALQSDYFQVYRDWFALLNRGYRLVGVGASDCHDVNRFIVGQGRTYLECRDQAPGRLDISEACRNLRAGRARVSLGLLTDMTVDHRFGIGDLATHLGPRMQVTVKVLGPAWVRADRVLLFVDGELVREQRLGATGRGSASPRSAPVSATVTWSVPKPAQDVYLVAGALGPGVVAPYWPVPHAYQATAPVWVPHVFASTNPIWVDGDGDGRYTSPRAYARRAWDRAGGNAVKLLAELATCDQAVAEQAAGLCRERSVDLAAPELERALRQAPRAVRLGFEAVLGTR